MFLFDFDGVLMNSLKEAGLSAYNAMHQTDYTSIDSLPEGCLNLFLNNSFHFHTPLTLCILMKWCSENCKLQRSRILTREEFQDYINLQDEIDRNAINEYFYSIRVKFMESSPKEWLSLNEPYQIIWNKLIERGGENVVILTAKNRKAVLTLCNHFGLKVTESNIYSGDGNLSKMDNFRSILNRFGKRDYVFIDDHLKNLRDLDSEFNSAEERLLDLVLCDWGYGDKADFKVARELGYQILSQEDIVLGEE